MLPESLKRIDLVTPDLPGLVRNGGVGTAVLALGRELALHGGDVRILVASDVEPEAGPWRIWSERFQEWGLRVELVLPGHPPPIQGAQPSVAAAYRIYHRIAHSEDKPDLIYAVDWGGLGYYLACSRRGGGLVARVPVVVGTHGNIEWHKSSESESWRRMDELARVHIERESVRLADAVISPSHHFLEWMRSHGWTLPGTAMVARNFLLPSDAAPARPADNPPNTDHLVFFGRLEERKGLPLLLDALDHLASRQWPWGGTVHFVGREVTLLGTRSGRLIEERSASWPWSVECHTELDQIEANRLLDRLDGVIVVPSLADNLPYTVLECLDRGRYVVSSREGGIPELYGEPDRQDFLFDVRNPGRRRQDMSSREGTLGVPDSRPLAEAIQWHLGTPRPRRPRPAFDGKSVAGQWAVALDAIAAFRQGVGTHSGDPLVSVCIPTRNRPESLRQAVASYGAQSYAHIELVIVDDGSDDERALRALDELSRAVSPPCRVIRGQRSYPGAARNRAALAAGGEYLLFADDDNRAHPNQVEDLVRAARLTGAEVVVSSLALTTAGGAGDEASGTGAIRPMLGRNLPLGLLTNCLGDVCSLVSRSAFSRSGGFREDYGLPLEDWEWMLDLALSGATFHVLPEPLFDYLVHDDSVSGRLGTPDPHPRIYRPLARQMPDGLERWPEFVTGLLREQTRKTAALATAKDELNKHKATIKQLRAEMAKRRDRRLDRRLKRWWARLGGGAMAGVATAAPRPVDPVESLLVAYSFPKTGTTTLLRCLWRIPLVARAESAHYLDRENLDRFQKAAEASTMEPQRTLMLGHIATCRTLRGEILGSGSDAKPLVLIGIRDPVATRLSAIFYHYSASPEILANLGDAQIIRMLRGGEPSGMPLDAIFDTPWYLQQEAWFDQDCAPVFHVNPLNEAFDTEAGYRLIEVSRAVIGVIRQDKFDRLPALIRKATGRDLPAGAIRAENTASQRADAARYMHVRQKATVSEALLDQVYSSRYCRRFFTEGERKRLRNEWSA